MEKSYVTMEACPICQKENGTILLDRRLRNKFDRTTINPTGVCDKCKKKYLEKGVLLINPYTLRLAVIKISAFKKIFNVPVPEKHIAFMEDEVFNKLELN